MQKIYLSVNIKKKNHLNLVHTNVEIIIPTKLVNSPL
jgi:hypothetical protein